ncbi:hypothetical protein ACHHYP_20223 [Achlya hypogyna]|uniref:Uncharacterized protein n=1 Tax=Achlya hypogyna TaxID=1202772 RepID=A0A1V9YXG5_ACHHY|nr:hypothetical protein ACHHYP_20223 [Achlya hypogyna]
MGAAQGTATSAPACLWCPGGSGLALEEPDAKKRKPVGGVPSVGGGDFQLSLYDDATASALESEYLAKSTEHGYIIPGKNKKRPRGGSIEALAVPEAFAAENLRVRRPRANTANSRASRGFSNGTNPYHYSNNSSYETIPSAVQA